ncbi:MAG TPA: ribosome-associated translation inhibitor RaiA [Bryobacteraceae bacterium]|jgi:putative sigma-54 modulation protein|nr:ribosome-associated translation inhibitor RaiA [Bryobacteraceae bacterium]
MKISYTGRHEEFPPKQRAKLEAKIQKLSKLMRGDKEAHVILSQERFLRKVEITMNAWDHALVGVGTDRDLVTAADAAVERLEKQLLKLRAKFRDTKRYKGKAAGVSPVVEPADDSSKSRKKTAAVTPADGKHRKKIFRVDHRDGGKPMTVDEAVLEMDASQDYMVYRDASTDRVTVLMRRPDGHFDLIES